MQPVDNVAEKLQYMLEHRLNNVYTNSMQAKIQKWGNSLGIRIPMSIIKELSLQNGSVVDIEEDKNKIIIYPSRNKDALSLIEKITDENLHYEVDWGTAEGDEIW